MKRDITITTPDGNCSASLFGEPAAPHSAGVILYMDIFGPRPSLFAMAERIALMGYVVLVPDLFYRIAPYGPFDPATAFEIADTRAQLSALGAATTQAMSQSDAAFFVAALTEAGVTGPIGAVGYCMGGARAINAAMAQSERIVAAASFHGGRLGSDAPDSVATNASRLKCKVYVGVAGVDDSFPPEQSARLARALREAQVDHIIENYIGCKHGWAVSDHSVYDHAGAERHWRRLSTFFAEALQQGD